MGHTLLLSCDPRLLSESVDLPPHMVTPTQPTLISTLEQRPVVPEQKVFQTRVFQHAEDLPAVGADSTSKQPFGDYRLKAASSLVFLRMVLTVLSLMCTAIHVQNLEPWRTPAVTENALNLLRSSVHPVLYRDTLMHIPYWNQRGDVEQNVCDDTQCGVCTFSPCSWGREVRLIR